MMKKSPVFHREHSHSAKTPAKVSTTPNLLPLKISPDDEHTKLEMTAMPFMPSLYSPEEDDEKKQTTIEHESFSLALPDILQDPFLMDDRLSFSPFPAQSKKRSHSTFVLRPRRGDRTGLETPFQEVGADSLPRKRPRMPLFVSLDGDARNDDHQKHHHGSRAPELELEAFAPGSDSSSSSPSLTNSSFTPRWSFQIDDMTHVLKSTSGHGLDEDQVHVVDPPNPPKSGILQGPDFGETVIALPRVFRPTIRRMTTSPSKSRDSTHGLPRVFVPSSTSAFSLSQSVQVVITPTSKPSSPSLSR